MPPKKTAPISQGVATRHRTRSAPAEQPVVASPPKKPKQYASSTDDSDIEVDIGDESQVEHKLPRPFHNAISHYHAQGMCHRQLQAAYCKNSSDNQMTTLMSSNQVQYMLCAALTRTAVKNNRIYQTVVCPGPAPCPAGPAELTESLHSFAAVTAYLRSRLLDTFSTAAASMEMRPKLQEVYLNLLHLLSNTAETPGANHSFLLLGARGTGKTLVRS